MTSCLSIDGTLWGCGREVNKWWCWLFAITDLLWMTQVCRVRLVVHWSFRGHLTDCFMSTLMEWWTHPVALINRMDKYAQIHTQTPYMMGHHTYTCTHTHASNRLMHRRMHVHTHTCALTQAHSVQQYTNKQSLTENRYARNVCTNTMNKVGRPQWLCTQHTTNTSE